MDEVGEMALFHFINPSTTLPNVSGLVVGGCANLKQDLVDSLDQRLAKVVVSVVDVQYGGNAGFHQAVKLTENQLSDVKFVSQQKVVSTFFEAIAHDKLHCYGVEDTMFALESGTVATLLLWDNLPHLRTELKSTKGTKKVVYTLPDEHVPGNSGEWEVESSEPLLDWILDHHEDFGSAFEFVSDRSSLGHQFVSGFGGFGALLRFDIPLPSSGVEDDRDDEGREGEARDESGSGDSEDNYEYVW